MHHRRKAALRHLFSAVTFVVVLAFGILWAFSRDVTLPKYPKADGTKLYGASGVTVDASNADQGYVMAKADRKKRLKLRISKDGTNYTYDLNNKGNYEVFPLQMGAGSYSVQVFEQAKGSQYAQIFSRKIKTAMQDESSYALYPSQYVFYQADYAAVQKAAELSEGLESDAETFSAIGEFVSGTIVYDYILALSVQSGYLPDPDRTLEEKKGICFDYAALVACMLRAQGIKCKMLIGYANGDFYHAWNEVLLGDEWVRYDATSVATGADIISYTAERIY
jgi:hypothetical protein